MATQISPTTDRRYGVSRICRIWALPRSSFYAVRRQKARIMPSSPPPPRRRPGPKPAISDEALLAAIRADLERSPWAGEGHRKVWARLRVIDIIRVSRKRVLRLMRAHALLSPHRARTRADTPHDRHIITQAPNQMWATDATQIPTVQDGKVWLFGVIEHWNAGLLGWHVAKHGTASRRPRPLAWPFVSNSATSTPAPPVACGCATIMAATSWPTISTGRSSSGASPQATPSSANPRPMG